MILLIKAPIFTIETLLLESATFDDPAFQNMVKKSLLWSINSNRAYAAPVVYLDWKH